MQGWDRERTRIGKNILRDTKLRLLDNKATNGALGLLGISRTVIRRSQVLILLSSKTLKNFLLICKKDFLRHFLVGQQSLKINVLVPPAAQRCVENFIESFLRCVFLSPHILSLSTSLLSTMSSASVSTSMREKIVAAPNDVHLRIINDVFSSSFSLCVYPTFAGLWCRKKVGGKSVPICHRDVVVVVDDVGGSSLVPSTSQPVVATYSIFYEKNLLQNSNLVDALWTHAPIPHGRRSCRRTVVVVVVVVVRGARISFSFITM